MSPIRSIHRLSGAGTACLWATAFLALTPNSTVAAEWRDTFRPSSFDSCGAPNDLSLATSSGRCVIVSGRSAWTYAQSTVDGRWPMAQSNMFAGFLEQTDTGTAKAVIGFEGLSGWDWNSALFGGTAWRDDIKLTDAYASIGDEVSLTAGIRDRRWGSIADIKNLEQFWAGDVVQTGQLLGAAQMFDWVSVPQLGGHVIQVEAKASGTVTLAGALEALENSGTAIALARIEDENFNAYAAVLASGFLSGKDPWTAFNAGARADFGETQIFVHATGAWRQNGPESKWQATAVVDHALGQGGLVGTAAAYSIADTFLACSSMICTTAVGKQVTTATGISAYAYLSSSIRLELGGQVGSAHGLVAAQNFGSLATRLVLHPTDTLEASAEVGTIWQEYLPGMAWQDSYVKGKVAWKPGGGVKTSLEGMVQENGAYRYTFQAEKRF